MTTPQPTVGRYPLLETLLSEKSFSFKGLYTNCDAATIFAVSSRTIQQWVRDGKLHARNLPGRGRFLSEDLENFLQNSCCRNHGGRRG